MAKNLSWYEAQARDAAQAIEQQAKAGEQLTFLPDERPEAEGEGEGKAVGRPKGAKNKVSTQMRDYLVARGCRLPQDVLIEIAGLNNRDDLITLAMRQTERVLVWAYGAAHIPKKGSPSATAHQRLEVFRHQYTMILRAAEVLMAYMAPKATPDVNVSNQMTVFVAAAPTAPADPAGSARDVTPQGAGSTRRTMPADVRHKIQQDQALAKSQSAVSDGTFRTEGASD